MAARDVLSASELLVGPSHSLLAAEDLLRRGTAPTDSNLEMPRAMVVVAHPDDETIALGARMTRMRGAHFVHVTDGAPGNEEDSRAHGFGSLGEYRQARARELEDAFSHACLQDVSRASLGYRDQEAALNLVEITHRIAEHISAHQPEMILTHPYEGGHPDHDACAFAVHHAVQLNRARGGGRPLVLEAPFYHAGPLGFQTGTFLEREGWMPEIVYELSETERARKRGLIACFVTQRETLQGFNDSIERFRIAPVYDFTRPPHAGRLLYEQYPWGMSAEHFCRLAEQAEAALDDQVAGAA